MKIKALLRDILLLVACLVSLIFGMTIVFGSTYCLVLFILSRL